MKTDPLRRLAPLLALFIASCAFAGFIGVPRRVAFNEADFATYAGPGTASVTGQLICSYEGEDHPGQGAPVTLLPVTTTKYCPAGTLRKAKWPWSSVLVDADIFFQAWIGWLQCDSIAQFPVDPPAKLHGTAREEATIWPSGPANG